MMEDKSFREFTAEIQKKCGKGRKSCKVTGSWGVYDAYKAIRKHGWYNIGRPLKEHEFYCIIRGINDLLAKELAVGKAVKFPAKMGHLELIKYQVGAKFIDGALKISYPVDWLETMRLWFEDKEAREKKTLLRNESDFVYKIRYNKYDANYENNCFYEFVLNKFIKQALKINIDKGKVDTLW